MYIQVTNTTKTENNQFQSTKDTLIKDVKNRGWKVKDCKYKEIPEAQIEAKYRGVDGKTGNKTYKRN